jgi:hypothetical protein
MDSTGNWRAHALMCAKLIEFQSPTVERWRIIRKKALTTWVPPRCYGGSLVGGGEPQRSLGTPGTLYRNQWYGDRFRYKCVVYLQLSDYI